MQTNVKAPRRPPVRTHEGAPAFRIGAHEQLRRTLMACLLGEKEFYESGQSIADRIRDGVANVSLETAAALALEAREVMHLRHAPLLVVREMARQSGSHKIGDTLYWVIQRADELPEFLAIYWSEGKEPLSRQVKRGLGMALGKFTEYDLAKYNRDNAVKLRDVMFMVHPTPANEEQAALWKRLAADELAPAGTWEERLSAGEDKKAVWLDLIEKKELGGLALLRNLRNMQEHGVPDDKIREAIEANPFKRVLPFRFIAAAKYAPKFEPELERAMFRGVSVMPKLPGKTVLLIDHSGSMKDKLSAKSEMTRFEAAAALGMLLREVSEDIAVYTFSDDCRMVPPRRGFALRDAIFERVNPTSTRLGAAKRYIDSREGEYQRIIVITDEQSQDRPSDPPKNGGYVINVASNKNGIGYGPWVHLDGWSEGIVRYIQAIEGVEN